MRLVHWVLLAVAVLAMAGVVVGAGRLTTGSPTTRTLGAALLLCVMAWVVVARQQLGRSFSVTPQARQLVTTGLYARIRNPIYVASPFLLVGIALLLWRWWPLLLLLIIVPVQIVRARREAAVLRAAFGEEYNRYRAQTWF